MALATEVTAEALCLAATGNYDGAAQTLERLYLDTKDPKIAINCAITDYYVNRNSQSLIQQLDSIVESCSAAQEEAAASTSAQAAGSGSLKMPLGSSGYGAAGVHPAPVVTLDPAPGAMEEAAAVCKLNKAILLYHQGNHGAAAGLLVSMVDDLEGAQEGHALHAACLLMDIYIAANQPDKAAAVLLVLEKAYSAGLLSCSLQDQAQQPCSIKASSSQLSLSAAPPASTAPPSHQPPTSMHQDAAASAPLPSQPPSNGVRERSVSAASTQENAAISSAAAAGSADQGSGVTQEHGGGGCSSGARVLALPLVTQRDSGVTTLATAALARHGKALCIPDGRAITKLYRVRLLLQRRAVKAAKHEIRALLAQDPQCWAAPLLKAEAEVVRGAPRKAAKLLLSSLQDLAAGGGSSSGGAGAVGAGNNSGAGQQGGQGQPGAGEAGAPSAATCRPTATAADTKPASGGQATSLTTSPPPDTSPYPASLNPCDPRPPPSTMKVSLYNNLGVAYHHMGRHHVAASFFAQALHQQEQHLVRHQQQQQQQQQPSADSSPPLQAPQPAASTSCPHPLVAGELGQLPRTSILYNIGLQHLLLGNWGVARRCLKAALQGGRERASPLALLRFAEASIGAAREGAQQAGGAVQTGEAAAARLPRHAVLPAGSGAGGPGVRGAHDALLPVLPGLTSHLARARSQTGGECEQIGGEGQGGGQGGSAASSSGLQGTMVNSHSCHSGVGFQGEEACALLDEAVTALCAGLRILERQQEAERAHAAAAAAAEDEAAAWFAGVEEAAAAAAASTGASSHMLADEVSADTSAPTTPTTGLAPPNPLTSPSYPIHPSGEVGSSSGAGSSGNGGNGSSGSPLVNPPASRGFTSSPWASGAQAASESALQLSQLARGERAPWAAGEARVVHTALLTNLAYAHTLRGDWAGALQAAKSLLALPGLSPPARVLGCCYAAEAACVLGRPQEAEEVLSAGVLQLQEDGGSQGAPTASPLGPPPTAPPTPPYCTLPGAPYAQPLPAAAPAPQSSLAASLAVEAEDAAAAATGAAAGAGGGGGGIQSGEGVESSRQGSGGGSSSAHLRTSASGAGAGSALRAQPHLSRAEPAAPLGNAADIARLVGDAGRATLLSNLASVFAAEGEVGQAREIAARAVALDPGCVTARLILVWVEVAGGRTEGALAMLRGLQGIRGGALLTSL